MKKVYLICFAIYIIYSMPVMAIGYKFSKRYVAEHRKTSVIIDQGRINNSYLEDYERNKYERKYVGTRIVWVNGKAIIR